MFINAALAAAAVVFPALAVARAASTSAGAVAAPSISIPSAVPPPTGTGTASITSFTQPPTVPITLLSTNPTALPLTDIAAGVPVQPTNPLYTTFAAGAVPTLIPGAPDLPSLIGLNPANYPQLDVAPPTNSTEVQTWIAQVASTGINIPAIPVNVAGGCVANENAVTTAGPTGSCWWTCGQCTRSSDITTCPDKFTWGLSFDDGPSPYTPDLLLYLEQQNLKTTFFIVGSRAISRPNILQTEYMAGHQLSVHTWSHTALTTQTTDEIIAELGWTAKVIKDVTGVTPNTMRPPYGDIDDRVRAISMAMGFTPIIWTNIGSTTFDTGDFYIDADTISASEVIRNFDVILSLAPTLTTGFIVLAHDLFQQTVDLAIGYILPDALAQTNPTYTLKPIISCLNKPLSDAYIETNDNSTNPPPNAGGVGGATTFNPTQSGSAQSTGKSAACRQAHTNPWAPLAAIAFALIAMLGGTMFLRA